MKRLLQILLAAALGLGLVACGKGGEDGEATARTLSYDENARKNLLDDPVALTLQKELQYVSPGWQNAVRWHPDLKDQWLLLLRHCGAISVPQACFKQVNGSEIRPDLYFLNALDGDMSDAILWRVEYVAIKTVSLKQGKTYAVHFGCHLQSAAMTYADHSPLQRQALLSVARLAWQGREWSQRGEGRLVVLDHPDLPETERGWWCETYTPSKLIVTQRKNK